METIMDIY